MLILGYPRRSVTFLELRILLQLQLMKQENRRRGLHSTWLLNCFRTMVSILSTLIFGPLGVSFLNWHLASLPFILTL